MKQKIVYARGQCANCGSEDIEYGESEIIDESIYYLFECNECGTTNREWYDLHFTNTCCEVEK